MSTAEPTVTDNTDTADQWPPLPAALATQAIHEGDPLYNRVRSNYMRVGSPRLVIMAESDEQVSETIRYAAAVRQVTGVRVPFSFRSGGHGMTTSSVNDGGIILDISRMNKVQVTDPATGMVRVQAGAVWAEVAAVLAPHDLVVSSGNFGGTGVGGLGTSGGFGYFARKHGLTIDRMRGAKIITADGSIHWVDDEHEPDLFWAVRGGGSQIGITTEFLFEAVRVGSATGDASVISQTAQYMTDSLGNFVEDWGEWIRTAPREMTSFLFLDRAGVGQYAVTAMNIWEGTEQDKALPVIEAAARLAPLVGHQVIIIPYPEVVLGGREPHTGQQRIRLRDVLVDRANRQLGEAFEQALSYRTTGRVELRSLGGAVSDVPEDATAWAGRNQDVLAATWIHQRSPAEEDEAFAPLQHIGTGTYGAYSSDTRPTAAELAWPGETGIRLREIARRVDPDRLFDQGLHLRHHDDT